KIPVSGCSNRDAGRVSTPLRDPTPNGCEGLRGLPGNSSRPRLSCTKLRESHFSSGDDRPTPPSAARHHYPHCVNIRSTAGHLELSLNGWTERIQDIGSHD